MESLTNILDQGEGKLSEIEDNVEQLEHSDKDKETTNRTFNIYEALWKKQIYESQT